MTFRERIAAIMDGWDRVNYERPTSCRDQHICLERIQEALDETDDEREDGKIPLYLDVAVVAGLSSNTSPGDGFALLRGAANEALSERATRLGLEGPS